MSIAKKSLRNIGPMLPGFETCETAEDTTCPTLISLPVDFPAKTSQMLANERELKASEAGCGQSSTASFASYDLATCSWKTCQLSLQGELIEYSQTWPRAGMMRSGNVYARPTLERLTSENESLSWRTPVARDCHPSGTAYQPGRTIQLAHQVQWRTPTSSESPARKAPSPIGSAVRLSQQVFANGKIERWRTPQADENGSITSPDERKGHNLSLSNQVQGTLNPEWVESLMGFPPGWTDISDGRPGQDNSNTTGNLQELSPDDNLIDRSA